MKIKNSNSFTQSIEYTVIKETLFITSVYRLKDRLIYRLIKISTLPFNSVQMNKFFIKIQTLFIS